MAVDLVNDSYSRTTGLPTITGFSMLGWFAPRTPSGGRSTTFAFGPTSGDMYELSSEFDSLQLRTYNPAGASSTGSTLTSGAWVHLAVVVSGTGAGQYLVYVMGVLDITADGASGTAQQIRIGSGLNGQIDGGAAAVKIYDAVLTPAEIQQEMRQMLPVRTANLNSFYPLLSTSDDEVDFSGSGNTMTVNGTPANFAGPPIPWSRSLQRYNLIHSAPADAKISELPALTSPALEDLLYIIDDPGGTAVDRKSSLSQLFSGYLKNVVVTRVTATGSGTYTPTSGMKCVLVKAQGGGGGGRSATATDEAGGGGGGGGYCEKLFTASDIGASKSYSVGPGGAANAAGTDTTFNTTTLVASGGGTGSVTGSTTTLGVQAAGGSGGAATGGDINIPGEPGGRGTIYSTTNGRGGYGGDSHLGVGGAPGVSNTAGGDAVGYGGGGAGGHASGTADRAGGAGSNGTIEFYEFLE